MSSNTGLDASVLSYNKVVVLTLSHDKRCTNGVHQRMRLFPFYGQRLGRLPWPIVNTNHGSTGTQGQDMPWSVQISVDISFDFLVPVFPLSPCPPCK